MKLSEIDDCSICPLPGEGLCPGSMVCYGGEPIEPPCTSWDGDEDVEDYIESVHASILEREEYEDRLREEREKKKRKNEIAKRKRQYLNIYCYSEKHDVKSLKKQIKSYESIERFADSIATAFNITNEMFRYPERKEVNPEITERLKSLREKLKEAEQKLKDKQKECRNTEKYKSIGKEQEDEEKH